MNTKLHCFLVALIGGLIGTVAGYFIYMGITL